MAKIAKDGVTTPEENVLKWVIIGVSLFVVVILLIASFYTVGAGERGVLLTFGKPSLDAKEPGLHMKVPIAQKVVVMTVQTQKYEVGASAASKDLQVVSSTIALNYHLLGDNVPNIFKDIGVSYQDRVIAPAVQESVKAATAQYTAEQLITQRPVVKQLIQEGLTERLSTRGIIVEDLNIVNFDFSDSFNNAIEAKVTAEQLKLKAERDLERIEVEAQQVRTKAAGERDAKIAQAEGEAMTIELVEQQLSKSPQFIRYLATQRWDGALPSVMTGNSDAVPFVDVLEARNG